MEFKWIHGRGPGFEDAAGLRETVFVHEQGFSLEIELDETDGEAWHVVGYRQGRPVCTGRLFWDDDGAGCPHHDAAGRMHIGRVAVLRECRGGGTGLAVMDALVARAREMGAKRIVLNAQADKSGFYEKAGFACTGATMLDEGVPHVEMEMLL